MKKYPLTTSAERFAGIGFSVLITVCLLVLVYVVRGDLALLIITALFSAILIAALAYYVLAASKAACTPDPENKKLHVTGVRNYTLDLSTTTTLETLAVKSGQSTSRALVFTDSEGNVTGTVPTLFTHQQGVQAEPMAIELAKDLGLNFKANVQPWEYDKEKRAEHDKEVAIAEKEAAKTRRAENRKKLEILMKMRIDKVRKENQENNKQ